MMTDDTSLFLYERQARVARMVQRAQTHLIQALDQALAPYDVTAAQYVILATLWIGRGDTAAQICKEISYTPGAMTRMLDRLEQKGLLVRKPHEESRRAHKLELTEKGQSGFPAMLAASQGVMNRLFGGFDGEDLARFEEYLLKIAPGG